jgi:sialic acid synthase
MNKDIKLPYNKTISDDGEPFIIAEIGSNHNGSIEIAKHLIDQAVDAGVSAVKFQVKEIELAFTKDQLDKPYNGKNSFGDTYRKHKQVLEFSFDELKVIFDYCKSNEIICFATPFDKISLEKLERLNNPIYKISSFHVTDLDLIKAVCETGKPVIISTGMSTVEEIDKAYALIKSFENQFVILHCVSSYPTEIIDINLSVITSLKDRYNCLVGYSGHEKGIVICTQSIAYGASVIERHFTLDRTMKGTDHVMSVEPAGMSLIVKRSKYLKKAHGNPSIVVADCELQTRLKNRGY